MCLFLLQDILLQDIPHWKAEDGTMVISYWENLIEVDFSHNSILHIDDSMVSILIFGHNTPEYEFPIPTN